MGRQLGRCKKCNCQATIEERDNGVCIWCSARKLENEDINWLLNEISALRDELARVKAESLRVVVDGDAVLLRYVIAPFAMTESRTIIKKNFGEWVSLDGAATNPSLLDTIAKPARLKPWEEE